MCYELGVYPVKFYCILSTDDVVALSKATSTMIYTETHLSKASHNTRRRLSESIEGVQGVLNHIQDSSIEIPGDDVLDDLLRELFGGE